MPKVSVVIPAYNAMKYLPETVKSVTEQTFTDFEVLIIDDGSSDNIREWALTLTDERVKLISQKNQGLAGARNTGITQAQGDYIAFVDADDLWERTKLAKQVKCLDENPTVGLVHTWMLLIDEYGKSTGRVMKSYAEGDAWQQVVEANVIACPSVVVRRCCFDTVGLFDPNSRIIEDWDMWIRIAAHYPLAVIKEALSYYRQVPNSMSKNCQVMEKSFQIVIEKAFANVPSELLYLKNRSYGNANLCLAWKALQSINRDYKLALHYRSQAINYHARLRFSQECIRLSLAIALIRWLKPDWYTRVIVFIGSLRRQIFGLQFLPEIIAKQFRTFILR